MYEDLLRIVRKGPAVKNTVDEAIDRCAIVMNLRDSIEEERIIAEQATEEKQKRIHASKGKTTLAFYANIEQIDRDAQFATLLWAHSVPGVSAIYRARHDAVI